MSKLNWKYKDNEVDKEYIKRIGMKLGIEFSQDYIECAMHNHGGNVEPNCFDIGNNQKVFGGLLSFNEESLENIVKVYYCIKEALPSKVIPFACDPSGNYVCFDYSESETKPKVVFWYHEKSITEENLDEVDEETLRNNTLEELQREAIYYVTDSFTELLNKLY
ncbi:SMI1/KNR4 family protein [Clostridium sp. ZS2-4]|uniref:SMI1/KNR4 family protein n=1 Tax=Clostridium sp. ZS2-4 TaxID=2987703 RepID=UPI00227D4533|nr:SMI1/KNR4 family protein [Clostridium sp. ZS2-4]MCY6354405.1 SMI1/KNR4 family protein [Clostridium sp. ZS2-4]